MKQDLSQLIEKWSNVDPKLSVANIADMNIRGAVAQLLENQEVAPAMLSEVASTVTPTSQANGQFQPIAMALVRRVEPDLFAWKCAGVQPMNGPVGLAYALRFFYKGTTREAGFQNLGEYSGFTGSTSGTSGTADAGTGVALNVAEAWELKTGGNMPELVAQLERTPIIALSRKAAANYSLEAWQDIKAMHNVDLGREIVGKLEYQIRAERDREIVGKMKSVAVNTGVGGEAAVAFNVSGAGGARWQQEAFSALVNVIVKKANDIATSTMQSAGNFVIVSPRVASAIQGSGPQFSGNGADIDAGANALSYVGSINGKIKVYRDLYALNDYALVGYKGQSQDECGIIYSPYITSLVSTATTQEDFSQRLGVMSRYAITDSLLGSGRYYRLINFTNLDVVMGG